MIRSSVAEVYHHYRHTEFIYKPPPLSQSLCVLQLFKDDIMYLLTMDKLWKKRKAPTPLDWQQLENSGMFIQYLRDLRSFQLLAIPKSEQLDIYRLY